MAKARAQEQQIAEDEGWQPLQAPRRPHPEQLPHHDPKVETHNLDQVPLRDLHHSSDPRSSGTARFADVSKAALDLLAPLATQPLATLALNPAPIVEHRRL